MSLGKVEMNAAQTLTTTTLADLRAAPRYVNPAIALCLRLDDEALSEPEALLALKDEIDVAVAQAEGDIQIVDEAFHTLRKSPAIPALLVPLGF